MRHTCTALLLLVFALPRAVFAQAPPVEDAVEAWSLVRNWINTGRVPAGNDTLGPAVQGVAIQLTWQGELIGADQAHRATGSTHPLTQAARGALTKALADHRFTSLIDPEQRGQEWDLRRSVLSNLAVEVELTGDMQPLTGPLEFLHQDVHPALDGLAVRRGSQWTLHFPSHLRAVGRAATRQTLNGMLLVHSINEVEADTMRRSGEVTVYRMPAISLRQLHNSESPSLYLRGREDASTIVASRADAISLSDDLAHGLQRFRQSLPETEGWFGGTWDPNRDEWPRRTASDHNTALCAYALARWAAVRNSPDDAIEVVWHALRQLGDHADRDPRTAVLALLASQQLGQSDLVAQSARAVALNAVQSDDPQVRAMAVLASVRAGDTSVVPAAVSHWLSPTSGTLSQAMPWAIEATTESSSDALAVHANLLRELLLAKQLSSTNHWGPEAAGAVRPGLDADSMGMPSLREGHTLSALIRNADASERIWLRDRALALATHLRRRTIGAETARQWASPDRAQDRVRLAPWDERVSISAQAFALLTALNLEAVLTEEPSE